MQEMMKAMMQGQGGDQFDMEEMQRMFSAFVDPDTRSLTHCFRHDGTDGWRSWRSWRSPRIGRWYAEHGGYVQNDGHGRTTMNAALHGHYFVYL